MPEMNGAPNRPDPWEWRELAWRTALAALLPTLVLAVQGCQLDGDVYHYVEYWHKLLSGVRHEFAPYEVVPKAFPIAFYGIVFDLTRSFEVMTLASIGAGALAAALLSQSVEHFFGRSGARAGLALLVVNPVYHNQCLEGSSAILQILWLSLAARAVLRNRPGAAWRGGACAMFAGVCRPEAWAFFGLGFVAALVTPAIRRRALPVFGLALAAIPLWLGFNWLLTGDPLFIFRVMVEEPVMPEGVASTTTDEGRTALWMVAAHYAVRLASRMTTLLPGPVFLLGLIGTILLWRKSAMASLGVLGVHASVVAFYFQPFSGGFPLLERFFVLPTSIHCALAGPALASLSAACVSTLETPTASTQRVLRALTAIAALTVFASLHSLHALQEWYRGQGAEFASATRELRRAVAWVATNDAAPRDRRLLVSPRRKGLAVLALGTASNRVESFLTVPSEGGRGLDSAADYILYDPRDALPEVLEEWSFLERAPAGFGEVELDPPLDHVRVYRSERLPRPGSGASSD